MIRTATFMLLAFAATAFGETPPERVDPAAFPGEAAVILKWEHRFTLEKSGAISRREVKWIQIIDPRAIRGVADPRIDFHESEDEVIVHTARTHLPDGSILPVPDYSYNIAGPNDVSGWPEWAAWRQKIVSFSGLRAGTVIEFDREVKTKAGVLPWLSAEVRLDANHPVVRHDVILTVPVGTYVNRCQVPVEVPTEIEETVDTYHWDGINLPSGRGEPQSRPWRERCPVVVFTTCPDHPDWTRNLTGAVEAASGTPCAGPLVDFAAKAVEDIDDPTERVNAVIRRLRDTTHLVNSWKTWRSRSLRPVNRVFESAYGSPLEYAAVALTLVRALGYETTLAVATERMDRWRGMITPADEYFASMVLLVDAPGGELLVHPRNGVFRKGHGFGGHTLLEIGPERPSETGRVWRLGSRGEGIVSDLAVTGLLDLDGKGKLAGSLTMKLGPLFFDPDKLKTAGAQKSFCENMIRRLIPDVDVKSLAIRSLSEEALTVVVAIAGKKAFPLVDGVRLIPLGPGPMARPDVPLPLADAKRRTDALLAGGFRESVNVRIKIPEESKAVLLPAVVPDSAGVSASVEQQGRMIRIRRDVTIEHDRLTPEEIVGLRTALRTLRATAANLIGIAPK